MTSPPSGTVVILGAGPAGLAAGYALTHAGWTAKVYELAPLVGGLARTIARDGYRFDIGGHRWFTKKDELNHFLVDLMGDELIWVDRISRIYFDGKFVSYPLKTSEVIRSIGPVTGARAAADFLVSVAAQRINGKPIVTMEDAYIAQFGRTLYELFFKNYSEKLWGKECANLSGDWVAQRSKGLSLFTAVRDAVRRTDNQVESLVEKFMYPRYGYGRISERLAAGIESGGGSVNLGWRVVSVQHDGQAIESITVSNGSREEDIAGESFVSSIPMTELTRILRPSVDQSLLNATEMLTFRDLITAHIYIDRPKVTDDTWVYVHDPRVIFARLHEPRNWSSDMVPEGKTSLVLEIFCEADGSTWRESDATLLERVTRDLSDYLGFVEPREVIGGFIERSRDAYPRYSVGYQDAVDAIKRHLQSYRNLSIVGRGGTFRYNNADHAIETGLLAARNILGEDVDIDSVNSESEYHEERRVGTRRAARGVSGSALPAERPLA
jgi:protoporphyrinogen oxidase